MTALITSHPGHRYAPFRERGEWRRVRANARTLTRLTTLTGRVPSAFCLRAEVLAVARTGGTFANLEKAEPPSA